MKKIYSVIVMKKDVFELVEVNNYFDFQVAKNRFYNLCMNNGLDTSIEHMDRFQDAMVDGVYLSKHNAIFFKKTTEQSEVDNKREIDAHLVSIYSSIGIDRPSNHDEILDFVYNDVVSSADKEFHSGDVSIAFRRWLEKDQ